MGRPKKKLGLQNFIILTETNEIVVIKGKEERKMKGKGRRTQCYFHLQDGRVYHSSKFKQIGNLIELNRKVKIEKILKDGSNTEINRIS